MVILVLLAILGTSANSLFPFRVDRRRGSLGTFVALQHATEGFKWECVWQYLNNYVHFAERLNARERPVRLEPPADNCVVTLRTTGPDPLHFSPDGGDYKHSVTEGTALFNVSCQVMSGTQSYRFRVVESRQERFGHYHTHSAASG